MLGKNLHLKSIMSRFGGQSIASRLIDSHQPLRFQGTRATSVQAVAAGGGEVVRPLAIALWHRYKSANRIERAAFKQPVGERGGGTGEPYGRRRGDARSGGAAPILEMRNIAKRFDATQALEDVSLTPLSRRGPRAARRERRRQIDADQDHDRRPPARSRRDPARRQARSRSAAPPRRSATASRRSTRSRCSSPTSTSPRTSSSATRTAAQVVSWRQMFREAEAILAAARRARSTCAARRAA